MVTNAGTKRNLQDLKLSGDKRFIVKEDGSHFFWLGDTAWELFHKLNREEAQTYLSTRAQQGFTVIQAVALAEMDGLRTPNAYGRFPLLRDENGEQYDPTRPDVTTEPEDYDYWDHVDFILQTAASLGVYIGFLPTWGDKFNASKWGQGPEVFTADNAYTYGKWLGERYRDEVNIVWILGGDRPLETDLHRDVVNAMAKGLREGDAGRHLMTFHPPGETSSSRFVHDETWLDFNMMQSGHGKRDLANYDMLASDYHREPIKPVLDGEPRYEDHPVGFDPKNGFFGAADIRKAAYWAMFAGGFGHTYGHHSVWSMTTDPGDYFIMTWREAIDRPGVNQVRYLRSLLESRPFLERLPAQDMLVNPGTKGTHLQATRGKDYIMVYSPRGTSIAVNLGIITGNQLRAWWYNPRNGSSHSFGVYPNHGEQEFTPPTSGPDEDWVLVLDDAAKGYGAPGISTRDC